MLAAGAARADPAHVCVVYIGFCGARGPARPPLPHKRNSHARAANTMGMM